MDTTLSIREAAARCGLSIDTLRYYERIGLIPPVPRGPGGQRRYTPRDLHWLAFLLRLRSTGMPLSAMQQYARLRNQGDATAAARRALLEAHLGHVEAQLDTLAQMRQVLRDKIAGYHTLEATLSPPQPIATGDSEHD